MIRYNYNQQVSPPAPFIHVNVQRPLGEKSVFDFPSLLDTAADMTVLPWEIVERLQLVQFDRVAAIALGGHQVFAPTFQVRLQIQQLDSVLLEVLADKAEHYILLGRDVLNCYRLVLDGPKLLLEIH